MLPNEIDPSVEKQSGNPQEWLLWIHLNEYVKLKDEQVMRMRFRDNLLYVTLAAFGGIISYALMNQQTDYYYAFLILPWVSLILGWTYVVNDEKISAIGQYLRLELAKDLAALSQMQADQLLKWETAHRSDKLRQPRKIFQLLIDETVFCFSGCAALAFFWDKVPKPIDSGLLTLFFVELGLILILGGWILIYADFIKGRAAK